MAATSNPCFNYDVFLSFRGKDTRKTFTDHLYAALKQAGIRTFRDDDAMDRGKLLEPELKKAIRESAISIIVFSRNYASSKWCLNEVLAIMEEKERISSKHEVMPLFYNIEPSNVRNQTGSFKEAFGRYDDMLEAETDPLKKIEWSEKVKAWRVCLRKAGSLTGLVLADGYEDKFISNVVSVIRKKLKYTQLYIEEKLVGIENHVAEIESWLHDPSPDSVILCIQGMGGIGKTTISKFIYNSNYHDYDANCFLANIHETSSQSGGLLSLQKQLLSKIVGEEVIWNLDEGIVKVRNALCYKKVLLILDDVKTTQQLTALLGPQQFHRGSKVIITTRDKGLLNYFKVHPKVQSINNLGLDDSNKLFSLYAFDRDHPIEPYIVQSERVVHYCGGLPLALKVLASSLKGKTIDVWEDAMRKLEAIPNPEIQNVLQVSYKTIDDTKVQELFLHVACFFVGEDIEFIVKLLAECDLYPTVGIQNLIDRSLLYVEGGRVMMHPLIMDMGREFVRQESPKFPGERSRLWNHQDSYNVLKDNEGTSKVEGLFLDMQIIHANKESFKFCAIEKMMNLMLLQLNYVTFFGRYKKLPKKLRLLRWHGFPLKSIPIDAPLQKLVVLDLRYSKLKQVWDEFKVVHSLKILNLSYSEELIKTPHFGGLPCLESLILEGCLSLTQVCESIRYLERLVLLDISGCKSLKNIPCLSRSLVSIKMNGCSNLESLVPVPSLHSFSLSSLLVEVNVSECNLFDSSFPEDWSNFFSLKILDISQNHITSLPSCVKTLPSLKVLEANNCSHLQSVIDVPESVIELIIRDNKSLQIVQPTPYPCLLIVDGCEKMRAVEGFSKRESIKNVDSKVIRYLGLESILENAYIEEDSIKVSYEFGIFSTWVSGETLPNFMFKESGSEISFTIPSHPNGSRVSGLNVCFKAVHFAPVEQDFFRIPDDEIFISNVKITNKTKDLVWIYTPLLQSYIKKCDSYIWLSFWRIGNLLDDGDEIVFGNEVMGGVVDECCVNLVYDDDDDDDGEQVDEEKKDSCCFFNNHISWNDRLPVEVSDYVHNGETYHFQSRYQLGVNGFVVDWTRLYAHKTKPPNTIYVNFNSGLFQLLDVMSVRESTTVALALQGRIFVLD